MTLQIVELVSLCNHYISKPNGQFCPLMSQDSWLHLTEIHLKLA